MGRGVVTVAVCAAVLGVGAVVWEWQGGALLEARAAEALVSVRSEMEAGGGWFRHGALSADPWRLQVRVASPEVSGADGLFLRAERLLLLLTPWDNTPRIWLEEVMGTIEGIGLRARALGGNLSLSGPVPVVRNAWASDLRVEDVHVLSHRAILLAGSVRAERISRIGGMEGVVAEDVRMEQTSDWHPMGGDVSVARLEASRLGGEGLWNGAFRFAAREVVLRGGGVEMAAARIWLEGTLDPVRLEGMLAVEDGYWTTSGAKGHSDRFALESFWRLEEQRLKTGVALTLEGLMAARASVVLQDLRSVGGGSWDPQALFVAALTFSEATLASASLELRDLGGLTAWLSAEDTGIWRWTETESRAAAWGMSEADWALRSVIADFVRAPDGRTLWIAATPPRPMTMEELGRWVPFLLLGIGAGPLGLTGQIR